MVHADSATRSTAPTTRARSSRSSTASGCFIAGGADGALHALKVRTGEQVWSYTFGAGVVNGSPVVDGNLVYCTHGEENPEGGPLGRVICVDAQPGRPETKKPKLVWDSSAGRTSRTATSLSRLASASRPRRSPTACCTSRTTPASCTASDAKDGEVLWKYRYGTEVRGAPLVADGKLYIFDVKAKHRRSSRSTARRSRTTDDTFDYRFPGVGGLLTETNGTPIAVNGRLYFTTRTDLFCIGDPNAKPAAGEVQAAAGGDGVQGERDRRRCGSSRPT